ncbi:polyprenyl synthetase family protein [Candidatus Bandiella numerosa]|uniref:polyprenyl synthetase family protein n=1 Tax=Candidatus Bandiella numerosa TaxID=2570586 RepID=UPI001F459D4A|nr:polyprenyl synthetase family protein [Candidatus Bandiella numerosa]
MDKLIIQQLINNLKSEFSKLDNFLLNCSKSEKTNLLNQIAYHIISSGGKRVRPLLTIATCKLFNPDEKILNRSIYLASSIEFIHTATLLHDDVVDSSNIRRNKPTANYIWGNKSSILVGDFLFSQSFKQMIKTENLKVLEILANISAKIAEAEVWQLELIGNLDIKFDEYINLITAKTANLFSAACLCSSILSNASIEQQNALSNYGLNLGILFQINDDIRDYFCNLGELGKNPGSDFFENKITLPIIIILNLANTKDLLNIKNILTHDNKNDMHFAQLIKLFDKYQVNRECHKVLDSFIQKGKEDLDCIQDSIFKTCLINLINSYGNLM